jgi:DNA-binding transcriptional ArsR family regulator
MIVYASMHGYADGMRQPSEPAVEQLTVTDVLHCLGDPIRLEIVRRLADGEERPCSDFHGLGAVTLPTLSHHLRALREAGLTHTRVEGKHRWIRLRSEDLARRFPGVLDAIVSAADRADAITV